MKALAVSATFDIGGQGIRLVRAFERYGADWSLRSMAKTVSYIGYETDLPFRKPHLEEMYQACDVFHARVDFTLYDRLAAKFGPKPVVIHHHGSKFRANPHYYIRQQRERNAIGIVSTLDLWLLAPDDLVWLPAPYNVDELAAMR